MSDAKPRIMVSGVLVCLLVGIVLLEYLGINATRYCGLLVVVAMLFEAIRAIVRSKSEALKNKTNCISLILFIGLLVLCLFAVNRVGTRPWIMLLLLITICGADIGAWFFGRLLGGDKMWERISANKTWSGQIAGILCGTFMSVMYGLLGSDTFMPQLMWIGISVSLLSQYGDLTASWVKRKLGIKDFGNILPGHGGVLDRFDGWIYVLPLIWLVML
ncbi:MAG: phosphatidate cytidylyltransferase [Alphaproteobacteria bacterium]|nr:phosphatidate cytidylyltransferase [Alphaproteobacteria bacterium]